MRVVRELDGSQAKAWEALVAACPASGFMQGLPWAAFKRRQGLRVYHLGLFEDGVLVGGAIAYGSPRRTGADILVSPDGPVLPWADETRARAGLALLDEAMAELAAREGAMGWRVEPRLEPPLPRGLRNFRRSPVDLLPAESLVLDLLPAPEALLATMHPKGRYNIRLAARRGVEVEELAPDEALEPLYAMLDEAAVRNDFFLEPRAFFAQLLETLAPTGHARVFVAQAEGKVLGALLLMRHGARATYLYGGVAHDERPRMAGYALQWTAIQAARAAGCTSYDFYGFDAAGRPDHLYARFSRFKRQFGGRAVRTIGAHEHLYLDRLADAVVRAVQEIGW